MKTGTDLMASPLFHYRPYRRRRWPYRYRWLLIGAGLLVAILVAMEMGLW